MEILNEGIDCKGRKYKRINIGKARDISGQVFNYLTPLFRVEGKNESRWLCQCICGNLTTAKSTHIIAGTIKSCGCYMREKSRAKAKIDYTGQKFNELTVISKVYIPDKKKGPFWKCLCSCGKYTIVKADNLLSGNTKSCGHLNHPIEDLTGNIYGYWTVLKLAEKIDNHTRWTCLCRCGKIKDVRADWLKKGNSQSCGCKNSSKGADKIEKIIKKADLNYKKEYCFSELKSPKGVSLRFDFAILDNNDTLQFLIEFDGELHYESRKDFDGIRGLKYRQLCDSIKNQYCINNNIRLYRIPYFDQEVNDLSDILQNKYLVS